MKKYVKASRKRYDTVDEIREDFIKKGWNKGIDFTEATEEDYKKVGFTNYKDGRKRFIMKSTGDWFNDDGEIYFYNIKPAKNPVGVGERIYDSVELSTDISDSSIRSGIIDAIDRASNTDPNVGATTWYELAETSDKIWAFVCAWLDLDSDGEYRLMGKIAYMPTRSAMSDYDYDWMMPELPNGDVVDTELEIDPYGDITFSCIQFIPKHLRCDIIVKPALFCSGTVECQYPLNAFFARDLVVCLPALPVPELLHLLLLSVYKQHPHPAKEPYFH